MEKDLKLWKEKKTFAETKIKMSEEKSRQSWNGPEISGFEPYEIFPYELELQMSLS